nr:unnamed protein product [Amyelois transitella]
MIDSVTYADFNLEIVYFLIGSSKQSSWRINFGYRTTPLLEQSTHLVGTTRPLYQKKNLSNRKLNMNVKCKRKRRNKPEKPKKWHNWTRNYYISELSRQRRNRRGRNKAHI